MRLRQARAQELAQLGHGRRGAGADQVGDQVGLAVRVGTGTDCGLQHARVLGDAGLDLAGLDAVAADLHLLVDPPDQVERARRKPAGQVARAVEAAARRPVRVGHEALGGEVGPVEVALRNAEATQEELATDTGRDRPQDGVEDVGLGVRDRASDGHSSQRRRLGRHLRGRADGRLADAVHVGDRDGGVALPALQQAAVDLLAADDDEAQRGRRLPVGGQELLRPLRPEAGGQVDDGDRLACSTVSNSATDWTGCVVAVGKTTRAPASSVGKTSSAKTSNPGLVNCRTRSEA